MTPGSLPIALLTLAVLAGCEGLDCPTGTVPRGAAPPEDWEQWCEGEDGRGRAIRSGPSVLWHDEGQKACEGSFEDNKRTGQW